jgi:hypothetical protein
MTQTSDSLFASENRYRLFTTVKYLTYILLSINVYMFLQEELSALNFTFAEALEPGQIIQSFSATIDTSAWVLLLLLFELETSVLDDSKIRGTLKLFLHGIRGLCYVAIAYAFSGYYAELLSVYDVALQPGLDACSLLGQEFSQLIGQDKYLALGSDNCAVMGAEIYRLVGFDIIADSKTLHAVQLLAWTDIANSAAWIGVVIVLEIEVRLQLRGGISDKIMQVNKAIKLVLYALLFLAAVYWGYAGDFLDFWDASLWLFAFIFIELNIFEWQHETNQGLASE